MSRTRSLWIGFYNLFGLALLLTVTSALTQEKGWRASFPVDRATLKDKGKGTYFILEPGYRLRLAHGKDTLTVTVLDDTRVVDGVKTRVVEEKETKGGKVVEISRNYFAIDQSSNDLYYFGEEVDIYKNGKITAHTGAWLAGINGARFGLMIPGKPKVGDKFYQEVAPKVAMDRAEIMSITEEVKVPSGTYANCLRTRESSDLEMGSEAKWYAPGVGLVRDADFVLVEIDRVKS